MAMKDLKLDQGCLSSGEDARWPKFELTDLERSQIRAAIQQGDAQLSNEQKIDFNLVYFNCTACHSRNDLGGVSAERSVHFQTTNLNLGEQGRIPPTLTGVGNQTSCKMDA